LFKLFQSDCEGHELSPGNVLHRLGVGLLAETTLRSVKTKTKERMTRTNGEQNFGDLGNLNLQGIRVNIKRNSGALHALRLMVATS
jgi:hypothetical protein